MRNYWIISMAYVAMAGQFALAFGMPVYSALPVGNGFPSCCCNQSINACCGMTCQCPTSTEELSTSPVNEKGTSANWEIHWLNPVNEFHCQGGNPFTLPGCELFRHQNDGLEFFVSESATLLLPLLALHQVLHLIDPPPPRR